MKARLAVIFLLFTFVSHAQPAPVPTRFDKFVHKPGIEWAAYASDTFHFPLLNKILLERLKKREVKASVPFDSRTAEANKVSYVSIDTINKAYFDEDIPTIDSASFHTTEVTQILFIENGCLKTYIPWVTPTLPVYISTGTYIGQRFYFNSAYNFRYNYRAKKRNKLSFIGQTKKMMKLDDDVNELKKMYGRNMLQALWMHVQNGEIELYNAENNVKIAPGTKNPDRSNMQSMPVPTWDSAGQVNKWVVTLDGSGSGAYTNVQLLQDWYYDHKKNIVISCIREVVVYAVKENKGNSPAFKMVFK